MYYVKKAKLDGYKNINKVNIDLHPGLNVIIGKNGVGKTNFLHFLDASIRIDLTIIQQFNIELDIYTADNKFLEIKATKKLPKTLNENMILGKFLNRDFNINISLEGKNIINNKLNTIYPYNEFLLENNINITSSFIKHGIFSDSPILDKSINLTFSQELGNEDFFKIFNNQNITSVCQSILIDVYNASLLKKTKKIKDNIIENSEILLNTLKYNLLKYNIVEDISLSDSLQISEGNNKTIKVENLFLQFKLNNQWYRFSDLSDGLKRIIYIFVELSFIDKESYKALILLEEPELGIHPHLIDKLMTFIKEVSQNIQIIITTHSPQILDYLDKDELDRIIIASLENSNTKLRHLTKKQIKDATLFLENESNLSDYWIHSDLEP